MAGLPFSSDLTTLILKGGILAASEVDEHASRSHIRRPSFRGIRPHGQNPQHRHHCAR